MKEWENVTGGTCPQCKAVLGTIWSDDDSETYYYVEPHGRMGNKSYRDDEQVGVWCEVDDCKYKKIYGQGAVK